MAKATHVYSTPPTNTSARHSRRSILGAIAAGSIAGLTPAIAAALPADPIYAAIELHKDLAKTLDAVWNVRGRYKDFGALTEAEKARVQELNDATDAAHLPLEAAALRQLTPASSVRFFTCESNIAMTAST